MCRHDPPWTPQDHTVSLHSLPLRQPGACLLAFPLRRQLWGLGQGRWKVEGPSRRVGITAALTPPLLPLPGEVCRPAHREQSREKSGLARPGDGGELFLGGPSWQPE